MQLFLIEKEKRVIRMSKFFFFITCHRDWSDDGEKALHENRIPTNCLWNRHTNHRFSTFKQFYFLISSLSSQYKSFAVVNTKNLASPSYNNTIQWTLVSCLPEKVFLFIFLFNFFLSFLSNFIVNEIIYAIWHYWGIFFRAWKRGNNPILL